MANTIFTDIQLIEDAPDSFLSIYRAKRMGRWFMLKALKPIHASNTVLQQLLKREFLQGYNLHHTAVAETYGLEEVPGVGRAVVMEWVDGISLYDAINSRELSQRQVERIAESLASYLDYIHSMEAIHKTLRPTDIRLATPDMNPKVMDFGFNEGAAQAVAGRWGGSRKYLSPELIDGSRDLDETTDTYSLGKIIGDMNRSTSSPSKHLQSIAERFTLPNPAKRPYRYNDIDWSRRPASKGMMWLAAIIGALLGAMIAFAAFTLSRGAAPAPIADTVTVHDTVTVEVAPPVHVDTAKMKFMANIQPLVEHITSDEWDRMIRTFEDYAASGHRPDPSLKQDYWRGLNNRVERRLQSLMDENLRPGDADYTLVRVGVMELGHQSLEKLRDDPDRKRKLERLLDKI